MEKKPDYIIGIVKETDISRRGNGEKLKYFDFFKELYAYCKPGEIIQIDPKKINIDPFALSCSLNIYTKKYHLFPEAKLMVRKNPENPETKLVYFKRIK